MTDATLSAVLRAAVAALTQGRWVLDELAPLFRATLLERVRPAPAAAQLDLLNLTVSFYGLKPMTGAAPSQPAGDLLVASSEQELGFWDQAAATIHPGARYRAPSEADQRLVASCLAWFEARSPDTYAVFRRWVLRIVSLGGARFGGGSHPHLFGCVFFDEASLDSTPERLAVALVHELAHQELFLLNLFDRLVVEAADGHLVHAPLQGRPRPTIGRLHAAHALYRMQQFEADCGLDADSSRRLLHATAETFEEWELTAFAQILWRRLYTTD